jgi:class 3 adenylate cyclase/tetratricopeptide (TPR) repeat protein/ribosomal protein L40E
VEAVVICSACGTSNPAGAKFCSECGSRLTAGCPTCGATNPPGAKFCSECGTRLAAETAAEGSPSERTNGSGAGAAPRGALATTGPGSAAPAGLTERRLVSVLFADLVGFTARSDGSDPERVREFLARYFELGRETIERYGGTVEKFIGDAVMAVWGTPVAQEDDAERAVRAALDLVDAVRRLGRDEGDESLSLRAGVLTGEAAVAVGAVGQGMVAGDLVNTASRLQSVAPPGSVLVGEATYRAASRAITFEPAGEQVLKGKVAPVPAWRALRIVAERGGLGRSEGIEAPFVGRDDELRLLKDILRATSRERRVRLVSVTGQAGVGKSRVAWEFLKYIDGLVEDVFWHQGRSPAFGDGVTFWALGEMVRRRAKLAETDDEATTRQRIAETLVEYVPADADRRRLEPALLSLLGVGDPPAGGREELFAALRTFFEQISTLGTTVLVFEDLQWADPGVLEFIDHISEWSIGYPILILTLARPELLERRDWGAGRRDLVALPLGALPEAAMREMLAGLVPDLPPRTVRAILERADGIPLDAVEIVRMLVADGRLEEGDGVYRVVGDLGDLRVPGTLQALIAARLDALDPADRALLQDASVLGQTFGAAALAATRGEDEAGLESRLRALVRREVLALDTDPRSPERGQYGFTQALVREVAYATLSKRDRRTKHLAAARHFESVGDEELAGVLATHYVDAYEAMPDGPEGEAVAAQARIALRAAADRATALGSHGGAIGFLERAREVTADPLEQAEILERIGTANRHLGHYEAALAALEQAAATHRERGDRLAWARVMLGQATTLLWQWRTPEARDLLLATEAEVADLAPDPVVVEIRSLLARASADDPAEALVWADRTLWDSERLELDAITADTLGTKGGILAFRGRLREGLALLEAGMRFAEAEGFPIAAARAANNLTAALSNDDPRAAVAAGRRGVELARRYGNLTYLIGCISNAIEASLAVGHWDWIDAELDAIHLDELEPVDRIGLMVGRAEIDATRGRDVSASVAELLEARTVGDDPVWRAALSTAMALTHLAAGRFAETFADALVAAQDPLNAPQALRIATRSAVRSGQRDQARETLDRLAALGARGRASAASRDAIEAAVIALEGRWTDAVGGFRDAWRRLRDLGLEEELAVSQLDCVAVAPPGDAFADAAAAEAREILGRIGARAFLDQLDELLATRASAAGRAHAVPSRSASSGSAVAAPELAPGS